jgi:hypothetical protein
MQETPRRRDLVRLVRTFMHKDKKTPEDAGEPEITLKGCRHPLGRLARRIRSVTQAIHEQVYHLSRIDGLFVARTPA